MKLEGQAAIVTGGASGLGRATAAALAAGGARVTIFDLDAERGKSVSNEIGGRFACVDILDEASVLAGFQYAREHNGQERVLVHCAQVSVQGRTLSKDRSTGGLRRLSTEDFARSANGILVASYRVASIAALGMAALDPVEDGERGVITLTSSVAAQDAQVGQIGYGAGKAGVNGLVLPLARDLMDFGIRANSIMPGIFATPPMLAAPEEVLTGLSASVPFPKRLGDPGEFASLVLELIRNRYMNGQALRLDGALRMAPR